MDDDVAVAFDGGVVKLKSLAACVIRNEGRQQSMPVFYKIEHKRLEAI
jgi:hypothetical protein